MTTGHCKVLLVLMVACLAALITCDNQGNANRHSSRSRNYPFLHWPGLSRSGSSLSISRIPFNATKSVEAPHHQLRKLILSESDYPTNYTVTLVTSTFGEYRTPNRVPNRATVRQENSDEDENATSERHANMETVKKNRKGKKLLPWNAKRKRKLPIRPPKLRHSNKTAAAKGRRTFYGSFERTRNLTHSNLVPLEYFNSSAAQKQEILELSSSEKLTSRMGILEANGQTRESSSIISLTSDDTGGLANYSLPNPLSTLSFKERSRNIPKLLLPKFSRPAMYSLNGFIPRPNMRRITTTSTSTTTSTTKTPRTMSLLEKKRVKEEQIESKSYYMKSQSMKKFTNNGYEKDGDLKSSDTSDRKNYVLTKRKGELKKEPKHSQSLNNGQQKYKLIGRTGQPGRDYPMLSTIPKTNFECTDQLKSGRFYADTETRCQVWHMCQGPQKHSFLCPNGTIFNQRSGICDWWYNVDCEPISTPVTVDLKESAATPSKTGKKTALLDYEKRSRMYKKYFQS